MPISRIFQPVTLKSGIEVRLSESASHHLSRVLRASLGDELILFNGEGGEYSSVISHIDKKYVTVRVGHFIPRESESPLNLYLAQGISKGEKMDFIIQKAVELGIKKIIPLYTQRSQVKWDNERKDKRLQHWRSVIVSACEQCGRNRIPEIFSPIKLLDWLATVEAEYRYVLSPYASQALSKQTIASPARVVLLIGPEGGLSEEEIAVASQKGFVALHLGPRILRTETAGLAAITALQCFSGDMA